MKSKNLLKTLGPGLLWAGAAVGVSHLVQSTRAGANYGFYFIGFLLLANFLKYPSFEFSPRYVAATGKSLVSGYNKLGKWAIILYWILTVSTMFAIQAAVTVVTAGLVGNIFNLQISINVISAIILGVTMVVLIVGKYAILDKLIKFIIIILSLTLIFAVIKGFSLGFHPSPELVQNFDFTNALDIAFLIAFIGWMPAPLDISIWSSFWSVAKQKDTGYKPKMKEALFDFNVGYIGTIVLALGFLSLGALVMYGTGEKFSPKGIVFAGQLIDMFTKNIGQWAYWIIAIAALTTMFSTTTTCLDAYSRVLTPTTNLILNKKESKEGKVSVFWMAIVVMGTLILLFYFSTSMKFMVDLATTISFVTAPFFAILNYVVVTHKHMPQAARPKRWLKIYAWIGIVSLSAFSLFYIIWRFLS
ncbi:MAG: divalent metal cation transporter [Bacteroidales bacterium]|nr:divalent metal cation transporter [Bacteroidales bacterium]